MKTSLFVFLFLSAATAGITQSLALNIDSVYITNINNGVSNSLYAAEEYTHDSACRIHTRTSLYYDYFTNQPVSSYRTIYTYYPDNNNIYQLLFQSGDTARTTFTNNTLTTYIYKTPWLLDTVKLDGWRDDRWVPLNLTVHNYSGAGDDTLELNQTWNNRLNAYVNYTQYLFDYDENGNETYIASQRWDTAKNQWLTNYEYTRTYDSNNYEISSVDKFYNFFTNHLDLTSYTTFYNNSEGYTDSSYTLHYPDSTYRKSYITYFPNSNQHQYRYDYDFSSKGDSTTSDLETHFLDSTGYRYLDSTTVGFRFQPEDENYVPSFSNFSLTDRNEDSTIRTVTNGNSTYYSDGTVSYNFVSRTVSYYVPCQSVLPITLLFFTADKKDNNALLQWKTANETNTAFFNIQRSIDGIHFTTIGTVKAAGNSSTEKSYTYTDFNIKQFGASKLYYRLAEQDVNGAAHKSLIARIDIIDGKPSITLSPNPVRNSIGIYSPVAIQNAVIRIANMSGTVVYTSHSNLSADSKLTIDASLFAKGIYFVTVQTNNGVQVAKLVKE